MSRSVEQDENRADGFPERHSECWPVVVAQNESVRETTSRDFDCAIRRRRDTLKNLGDNTMILNEPHVRDGRSDCTATDGRRA